jgi:hypothetical protein
MSLDPVTAGLDLVKVAVNKIWPDKTEQEKAELAAAVTIVQGQIEVNKAEATNPSIFVSGWRPYVGWVCGMGLAYSFLGQPLLEWGSINFQFIAPPKLDMGDLITILLGMLGLGGLRTYEKKMGVAAK